MSTEVYFVIDTDIPKEFMSLSGVNNLTGRPYLHIGCSPSDPKFVCGIPEEFIDFITFDAVVSSEDSFVEQGIYEEGDVVISVRTYSFERSSGKTESRQEIHGRSQSIEDAVTFLRRLRSGDCFPTESWDRQARYDRETCRAEESDE